MGFHLLETDNLDVLDGSHGDAAIITAMIKDAEEGLPYAEIAEKYGLKLGTVKSRLNRARLRILASREPESAA